jgi:DNA-binding CsgD family transcriptional regulator
LTAASKASIMITATTGGLAMVTIEEYSQLVAAIHSAAITEEHWLDAMARIRKTFHANSSAMLIADGTTRTIKCASLTPEAMAQYKSYYHEVDYVLGAVESGPVGLIRNGAALVALNRRSEFTADWLRPHRMTDGLFVRLTNEARPTCFLIAAAGSTEGYATAERVALVNALVPHLQQALRTQTYLGELVTDAADASQAIDGMRHAVLVVGSGGAVVHANAAAEVVLAGRDGVGVASGRLVAGHRAADDELQRAIARAIQAGSGSSLLCPRASEARPFVVHVTPFGADGAARALVVVVDPDAHPDPTADLLRSLFGLTKAEADVALMVVSGHGLQPISDELTLSLATVKTHLQHVFAKTATHRQAELVRLLLSLTP